MKEFLDQLKLSLSLEKTLITDIKKDTAKFLGVLIGTNLDFKSVGTRITRAIKKRIGYVNITLRAPTQTLADRLKSNGFWRPEKEKIIPQSMISLTPPSYDKPNHPLS